MLVSANSNQPWNSQLPTLVLLQKCKTLNDINQIHARIITTGFVTNPYLTTKIILKLSFSPHKPLVHFARYLFFSRHARRASQTQVDPFLWNSIIKTYSHGDDPKQAFALLCLMLEYGVCVDKFSLSLVLKACSRLGFVKEGMQIHCLMSKMEIGSELFLENCLILLYVRCGCIGFARQVFDKMTKRDSVSFNLMIDGYVKSGMVECAREVFDYMPIHERNLVSWNSLITGYSQSEDGLMVAWELFEKMPERDLVSWNSMIDACLKCGKLRSACDLFNRMPKRDVISWANMIDGHAKLGSVHIARKLFDEMPERDVISYNAMMGGYVENGYFAEALELFREMRSVYSLSPDNATLLIVLSAMSQLGHIDEGIRIHLYMRENGIHLSGKLGVSLIDMYSKCGSINDALRVFRDIREKNVDHYNAMIGGLAIHGMGESALDLFFEMERLCVKPDDITFIGLLNACGHAGLVKEGLICFELMKRVHNLKPKLQHYGCVVDILSRAGHLNEAKKFIENMPIEPNDVIWRTLLSACINHEDFKIGEVVGKRLIELGSSSSSSYVLLSNIYAGSGLWNHVRQVRAMMKEREVTKVPGCSWIELEGIVHEFFARDEPHSEVKEIYSMVYNLPEHNLEFTCCNG